MRSAAFNRALPLFVIQDAVQRETVPRKAGIVTAACIF